MEHLEIPMTINEARSEIQHINQMANNTGNIDSENNRFKNLLDDLNSGKVSPGEAVKQARYMLESRDEI